MKLCMFHPNDKPMERGWVGRIDGERVLHLAAQTLQSFFLGGGGAREHAEYTLDGVTLLVPVLYPPAVRVFYETDRFEFANPASVFGPGATIAPPGAGALSLRPRVAAVVGNEGELGGFSVFADWRRAGTVAPKDRDFGSALGPVVVTPDETSGGDLSVAVRVDGETRLATRTDGFDWDAARALAAEGTLLRPGDLLVAPAAGAVEDIRGGSAAEIDVDGIGVLCTTAGL